MNDQTAEPIGPKFCEGPLKAPSEGLWMIKMSKLGLQQHMVVIKILNFCNKIRELICLFLFYNLKIYKEKMFTIQIEM